MRMSPMRSFAASFMVIALLCGPAAADDDALLQLIEVLHDNGTINDEAYRQLRAAAAGDAAGAEPVDAPRPAAAGDGETADRESSARVDFEGRKLRVESADGRYRFRLGGRIMADGAHYDEDVNALGSGTELRRVRLSWDGVLGEHWRFKSAAELAGGVDIKGAYIDYLGHPGYTFRFGRSKELVSLEELTSSKYTTFMERAMLTELTPGFNIGLAAGRTAASWGIGGGLYAGGEDGEDEQDEGFGVTGRAYVSPWRSDDMVAHLGLSASYRESGDSRSIRFRARPESHVTDNRLIDTGTIADVDNVTRFGFESALVAGPVSLQAEYLAAELDRGGGLPDLGFDGWYAYASWFPTGESRRYDEGEFGRVTPLRPLGSGGAGAFELGLRFSTLDLTDQDVTGGEQDNLTFGLNWYPTSNVRFMANYIEVLDLARPGSPQDGDNPSIYQIRGQVTF